MSGTDEIEVYITNFIVHDSKPFLFGVTLEGTTVGIRVMHMPYAIYIEPRFDATSEDKTRQWFDKRVRPFLETTKRTSKYFRPSSQLVHRKRLCGFSEEKHWFVKAIYDTVADAKQDASAVVRKFKTCTVYHDKLDPNLIFTAHTGLRCFMWVTCSLPTRVHECKATRCDIEVLIDVKRIRPKYADDDPLNIPPPLRIATFDIETDGLVWDKDELRMISVNCQDQDFLLTRHPLDVTEKPDYTVVDCNDEKDLIKKFVDLIHELRPVFLTGWNIFRFDVRFVFERAKILGVFSYVEKLSWLSTKKLNPVEKEMNSNAFGQNQIYHDDIEGLITLDGYILARKGMKMPSYSLKAFGEWIGDNKGDVTYQEMVEAFSSKNPRKLREVADYCVQDSRLVPKILARMEEPDKVMAMTRLAAVPPLYSIKRGQSILTFGLILGEAFTRELVVNPPPKPKDQEEGYKGATVIDPMRGYHKDPVAVLDFESLYPSIMRAYNICISTFIKTYNENEEVPSHYTFPEYSVIEIDGGLRVVFNRKDGEGVFPAILRVLLKRRKEVKGLMKKFAEGTVEYNQANAKQLSLKVAANSMYGYLGASTSQIYEKALAASVTSMGRQSLFKVRTIIQDLCKTGRIPENVHVVYGDSVSGDTPLVLRINGKVCVRTIDQLDGPWAPFHNTKEAFVPSVKCEVWQDGGFTEIRRVIRHKASPFKPLVRVVTGRGMVDCTTDHSLLRENGEKVGPMALEVGDFLLHSKMDALISELKMQKNRANITEEEAFEMGVYENVIPDDLLYAPTSVVRMFWEGFDAEQGYHTKARAAMLYLLGLRLGLSYRFTCYDEASNMVALVPSDKDEDPAIHHLWLIPPSSNAFVYDLETESHHFGVGPGTLVAHNTDSVMVKFPGCAPEKADEWAKFIEQECTQAFVPPMRLEYENLFVTYLLENKKKYCARVWNPDSGTPPMRVIKGLSVKRRDFPKIVQKGLGGMLDILLEGGDDAPQKALDFVDSIVRDMWGNKVDPGDLCITKELNKSRYSTPPPHLIVSQKMALRNPHDPPKPGDRITFVVLSGTGNVSDRVEEFDYVLKVMGSQANYDISYYIDQLASQCKNMMRLCGVAKEFNEVLTAAKLRSQGQSRLTAYFGARIKETEESGDTESSSAAGKRSSSSAEDQIKPKKQASLLRYIS